MCSWEWVRGVAMALLCAFLQAQVALFWSLGLDPRRLQCEHCRRALFRRGDVPESAAAGGLPDCLLAHEHASGKEWVGRAGSRQIARHGWFGGGDSETVGTHDEHLLRSSVADSEKDHGASPSFVAKYIKPETTPQTSRVHAVGGIGVCALDVSCNKTRRCLVVFLIVPSVI